MSFEVRFLEPEDPIEYPCCVKCIKPICPLDDNPNAICSTLNNFIEDYNNFWAEKSQHLYQNWLKEQQGNQQT